jgi:branched-chain amino acid transport system ATP-binding protein
MSQKSATVAKDVASPDAEAIVSTHNLTKTFSGLVAVDDVSWKLKENQTMGVVGPNGAGKSTFFNLITGVLSPTSGRIRFQGKDITSMRPDKIVRKGIVKTFQTNNLFAEETVEDNIKIAAQSTHSQYDLFRRADSLSVVGETTDTLIDQLGLEDLRTKIVETLSHGDQRKVEIGLALATNPEVVFLDEPTSGVSNEEMDELSDVFTSLINDGDYTVVLIEHNIDFLMELVDEITVLHEGEILVQDGPESVMENDRVQSVYLS